MSDPRLDPQKLLEQAQELTGRMKRLQEELRHRTVEATVGGGMVRCCVNGQLEVTHIEIDPRALDPEDIEMLQDLIVAAVNQGIGRARELAQQEMQRVTGLPLTGLFAKPGG